MKVLLDQCPKSPYLGLVKVTDLKPLLKARGITQVALAEHLGVSRVHVTQMLSGKRRMSVDVMNAIEVFLANGARATEQSGVAETSAAFEPKGRSVTLDHARKPSNRPRMSDEERRAWLREIRELGEAGKRLPRITDMSDDEILGYDETK